MTSREHERALAVVRQWRGTPNEYEEDLVALIRDALAEQRTVADTVIMPKARAEALKELWELFRHVDHGCVPENDCYVDCQSAWTEAVKGAVKLVRERTGVLD